MRPGVPTWDLAVVLERLVEAPFEPGYMKKKYQNIQVVFSRHYTCIFSRHL